MSPNGSDHRNMPPGPQHNAGVVFNRMSRYIGRLAKSSATSDVHRFRTNSRRVEALIEELVPQTRNKKKLLKLLAKFRKRAGRLRDLDVQIVFLDSLRIPDRQNHRAQLLEWFATERTRRARKLVKGFDRETILELRKRLRRAQSEMKLDRVDPLKMAFNRLPKPDPLPLSEPSLHACRIASKQARYLAELALDSADAKFMVE